MSESLRTGLIFLINAVFDLYLMILMIRIILAYVGANYFDPVTQFVTRLTNFLVKPLRRGLPNYGRLETASIVLLIGLEILKFALILALSTGTLNITALLLLALADAIKLVLNLFFYAILIQVILTWVQPHSPMSYTLYQVTSPLMRPIQRLIPPIGGIDISPIPALIILQFLSIVLVNPLMSAGMSAALT